MHKIEKSYSDSMAQQTSEETQLDNISMELAVYLTHPVQYEAISKRQRQNSANFTPTEITQAASSNSIPAKSSLKHSKATMLLHWGTALAIIISVSAMFAREYIEVKTYRIILLELHRQLGMVVLIGVAFRLIMRCVGGMAKPVTPISIFTRLSAGLCHLALYALLVIIPFVGLAVTNAHNVDLNLFGLGHLPRLVADDPDLADELTDYHILGSWILLGALVLHIGAALLHHFVIKDEVLSAMLPHRQTRGRKKVAKLK